LLSHTLVTYLAIDALAAEEPGSGSAAAENSVEALVLVVFVGFLGWLQFCEEEVVVLFCQRCKSQQRSNRENYYLQERSTCLARIRKRHLHSEHAGDSQNTH
jgi:hypothetical protein